MGTVDEHRAGVAAAVLNSARQTGAALGVAIFGTLIATFHSFEAGMRVALRTAVVVSLAGALVWLLALIGNVRAPEVVLSTIAADGNEPEC
jgi:DHA2 family methylenomycin A resistance protein-like MFS transporter